MLKIAILEKRILKTFWGSILLDPRGKLVPSALFLPLPFESSGSAPEIRNVN